MTGRLVVDGPDRVGAVAYTFIVFAVSIAVSGFGQPAMFGPVPWGWAVAVYGTLGVILAWGFPVRVYATGGGATDWTFPLPVRAWTAAAMVVAFWVAAGAWVGYGWVHGWGSGRYWMSWLGGFAATATAAATWAPPTNLGLPMQPYAADLAAAGLVPAADPWAQIVAAATKGRVAGVTTRRVDRWESGCGYSAYLTLPGDGSTDETLQPYQAAIAAVLDVPRGGGVTVFPDPDGGARAIRVDVLETDAMASAIDYPGLD